MRCQLIVIIEGSSLDSNKRVYEHLFFALVQQSHHIHVSILRRFCYASAPVSRAPILEGPLQHLDTPVLRRGLARDLVPRAAVRARPLQHFKVTTGRRPFARLLVPWASVCACPLQNLIVPATLRPFARFLVPWPAAFAQQFQLLQLSAERRCLAHVFFIRIRQLTSPLPAPQRA